MTTYTETVYRFRIVKREIMPETHATEAAARGFPMERDADGRPYRDGLYMSFQNRADAERALARCAEGNLAPDLWSFYLRDAGETSQVERSAFL